MANSLQASQTHSWVKCQIMLWRRLNTKQLSDSPHRLTYGSDFCSLVSVWEDESLPGDQRSLNPPYVSRRHVPYTWYNTGKLSQQKSELPPAAARSTPQEHLFSFHRNSQDRNTNTTAYYLFINIKVCVCVFNMNILI